jgi:DNA-binding response OmpR family regulator
MARILVLEDDGAIRSIVKETLLAAGHDVLEAADGRAGLRVFGANRVDLVITDLLMPDMDGVELVRTIRAYGSPVHIIAISGGSEAHHPADLLTTAVRLGADAALPKPFRPGDLRELVVAVLALPPRTERLPPVARAALAAPRRVRAEWPSTRNFKRMPE